MDALPSETEMARDLEAITIDPGKLHFMLGMCLPYVRLNMFTYPCEGVMDEDLRAALFEDEDDDGAFEALDDDFCMQVSKSK